MGSELEMLEGLEIFWLLKTSRFLFRIRILIELMDSKMRRLIKPFLRMRTK